ncbi:MAG: ABC transporter permease, partial [Terriglobales bacterium]
MIGGLIQDFRYAMRQLRKSPGITLLTILTLALGIGATTAIFSAVSPILFKSLPYPHGDRIVAIWEASDGSSHNHGTFGMFKGLAEGARTFKSMAVLEPWQPTVSGAGEPERIDGQRVSVDYFRVLGVSPMMGRDFQPSDDRLHGPCVVILRTRLWRRRFQADSMIIGRQITLDESAGFAVSNHYTVIGVMPEEFDNVLSKEADLWAPLQYDISQERAWGHHLRMIGR